MRYIDIRQLLYPNGWPARARQALADLKTEIATADAQARKHRHRPPARPKANDR